MARTESSPVALGTPAPSFALPDVISGQTITLDTFADMHGLLVMFICRHCPFVKHIQLELPRLGNNYAGQSLGIMAISSNDAAAYPDDAPESLREMATELGFNYPFCFDETQEVARSFDAVCTPDFYLYDQNRRLVYHGQLDDSRPGSPVILSGRDLRHAIDSLLSGRPIPTDQKPSIGCSIKWKR
ncbi:MAG: thioredoxin family protein [Bryobacteraceae bacterium]